MSYSAAGYESELLHIQWIDLFAALSLDICVEHYSAIGLPFPQSEAFRAGLRAGIEEFEEAARHSLTSEEAVFRLWPLVRRVLNSVEADYGRAAVLRLCLWAEDVYPSADDRYRRWGPYDNALREWSARRALGKPYLDFGKNSWMLSRFRELISTESVDTALKRSKRIPPSDWDRRILQLRGCEVMHTELGISIVPEGEAEESYQSPFDTILDCASNWRFVQFLVNVLDELDQDEISLLQKYASEKAKRPAAAPEALARRVRSYWSG
jgi:hypothetical protein